MSAVSRMALWAGALAVLIVGCSAAAHLRALQPETAPESPPLVVLAPPSTMPPSTMPPSTMPPSTMQLGVDIDAYIYPGQNVAAAARNDVAYIESLHANAVSISFPFFMDGPGSDAVTAGASTPTPGQLATIVAAAANAGLYVSVRPLLDEASLGVSRVLWVPSDPTAWFASYQAFVLPYAAAAQRAHAREFIVGAELTRTDRMPQWNGLDSALARRFSGTLAYANNWGNLRLAGNGGNVAETVDAYPPAGPPFLQPWVRFDQRLPPGTVETEVGIAAVGQAWRRPYQQHWSTGRLDPAVQARWFAAACAAARATHLAGIYFWAIDLGQLAGPTLAQQGNWAHSAGATAISQCFTSLGTAASS
jgi:hypothetical protein